MRSRLVPLVMITTLTAAACGSGASGDQAEVVDLLAGELEEQGIDFDRDCANDIAGDLSDEDAAAIVDAGVEGDPETSDEAEAIGQRILDECVDVSSFVDSIIDDFAEDSPEVDTDCFREQLSEASTVDEVIELSFDAAFACVDG